MTQIEELMKSWREEREKCQNLDTQLRFKEFQIPEIHDHQKFKNDRQEIHRKVEKFEEIKRKANEDGMKIRQLIDKIESLNKEVTKIKITMEQCNTMISNDSTEIKLIEQCNMIESQKTEVQQVTKAFEYHGNANDLVDHINKITGIGESIIKWFEGFQSLEEAVCSWRKINCNLEEMMVEMEENTKCRDKEASDSEEHISFLQLLLELEMKMNDYKEKVTKIKDFTKVRKKQKEELSDRCQKHENRRYAHHIRFGQTFRHTEEELKKSEGQKWTHSSIDNEKIKHWIEDIQQSVKKFKEMRSRIQEDGGKIRDVEHTLEEWNSRIEKKCREEIYCLENKQFRMEDTSKIKSLCSKLDSWNEEYEQFEAEHARWTRNKCDLEDQMKSAEQNMDDQETNIDSLVYLNRMIDVEKKVNEHRNTMEKLFKLEEQKKDAEIRLADKMEEEKRNVVTLDNIKKELKTIKNHQETKYRKASTFYPRGSVQNMKSFWKSVGDCINCDLVDCEQLNRNAQKRKTVHDIHSALHNALKLNIYCDKNKFEQWNSYIKDKYEQIKQKNEEMIGAGKAFHMMMYMVEIETIIDLYELDKNETISAWNTEKDKLENQINTLEDKLKDQYELISKMEKRVHHLNFLLNPEEVMKKQGQRKANYQKQKTEAQVIWATYLIDHGNKFDNFNKMTFEDKSKLVEILNSNQKFMNGTEEEKQDCDDIKKQSDRKDVISSHEGIHQRKRHEEVVETISEMSKTALHLHKVFETEIGELQKEMDVLDGTIKEQYTQYTNSKILHPYLPLFFAEINIPKTLEEIENLLMEMEKWEQKIQLGLEKIRNWQETMNKVEESAEALELNPFNIQLHGFSQLKEECMTIMSQQKDRAKNHDLEWNTHVMKNKRSIENMYKINNWTQMLPHDAMQSYKEMRDYAQEKVNSSIKDLSDIHEQIGHCQKEMETMGSNITDLKNKMTDIVSIAEHHRIFAIESMSPKHIADVFMKLEKWNEMFEGLKETIHQWVKKKSEFDDNVRKWENVLRKKSEEKFSI